MLVISPIPMCILGMNIVGRTLVLVLCPRSKSHYGKKGQVEASGPVPCPRLVEFLKM